MCDLFSTTADQSAKTNSSQTGTSKTQNNAWDTIKPFLTNYMQQYNSGNVSSTGTPNLYQDEAGGNQGAVANPSTLQAGFDAASGVAGNGITTADIQSYMSPYIQNVVNPTLQAQEIQNKQAISNMRGNQAAQGALGNNTGSEAAYYAGVQPGQQQQIASLYDQGYNKAVDTAGTSAGLKLQGASGLGNLSNAASGANRTLYDIGQGIFNTNLTPYELMTKGVSGLAGLAGLAGSKVSTTGNSTGYSSGTTSSSPSLGSIILGGIGTAMSGFHRGGAVPAYADGGGVSSAAMMPFMPGDDMTAKVGRAFKMLHGLKTAAQGGTIDHYDVGGVVPYGPWDQPSPIGTEVGGPIGEWETTVTPASKMPAYNTEKVGQSMMGLSDKIGGGSGPQPSMGDNGLGQSQAGLSQFLGNLASSVRPAYEDGGAIKPFQYGGDEPPVAEAESERPSFLSRIGSAIGINSAGPSLAESESSGWKMPYTTGVWAGEQASPMQRFGAALAQVGDGPFAPFGKSIMDQQQLRFKDIEAQRLAEAARLDAERFGMEQEMMPHRVALTEAQTRLAQQEVDPTSQEARRLGLDKIRAETESYRAKADDPIATMILERMRNRQPKAAIPAVPSGSVPPATVQPQSMEGPPGTPGLQLISDEQPAIPGPAQAAEPEQIDTLYGPMTRDEASEMGAVMLLNPKYAAAGKALLDSLSGGQGALTKAGENTVDEKAIGMIDLAGRLDGIMRGFKPEYQTYETAAKMYGTSWLDSFDATRENISPEDRKEFENYTAFRQDATNNLSEYIKFVTGAAMGIQEEGRIRRGMPDPEKDSPSQFEAKAKNSIAQTKLAIARYNYLKRNGYDENIIQKMAKEDKLGAIAPLNDMQGIINQRLDGAAQELKRANPNISDMQLKSTLRSIQRQEFGI